jgi:hypothetical protein
MASGTYARFDITSTGVDMAVVGQWESTSAADQRARLDDLMDA